MTETEMRKVVEDYEAQQRADAGRAGFADLAIRYLRTVGRDAEAAAAAEGATAASVLHAVMRYLPNYVKDLRSAMHRPEPQGAGLPGLGLSLPSADERAEQEASS